MKTDMKWMINNVNYIIRNVPYITSDYDDEPLIDLDVSIKLAAIRDLMYENEIPHEVDFNKVSDLEI